MVKSSATKSDNRRIWQTVLLMLIIRECDRDSTAKSGNTTVWQIGTAKCETRIMWHVSDKSNNIGIWQIVLRNLTIE